MALLDWLAKCLPPSTMRDSSPERAPPNIALAQILMAGGLLDKEANLKKTSLNLKDKLSSDLLLGFQALLLVKVLASKLVTHLRHNDSRLI